MKQRQRWALNKLVKIPSYHIPPKSEKYIWISDQISCCQDAGHAGGIEAGGRQPGGGLRQLGEGLLQQPCPSGKLFQS